jgi:hypothetical protein
MCMSEFQLTLSKFSESLMTLRQKTLQSIQLSTELDKRATVRKCLDEVTVLSQYFRLLCYKAILCKYVCNCQILIFFPHALCHLFKSQL